MAWDDVGKNSVKQRTSDVEEKKKGIKGAGSQKIKKENGKGKRRKKRKEKEGERKEEEKNIKNVRFSDRR